MFKAIASSLPSTKLNLSKTNLILPCTIRDIFKAKLIFVISPSMREDSVRGDVSVMIFGQIELAILE